ncbi:hypothetical protein BDV26DRAFT_22971 [Aspergillus bertholletiae]|uniref:Uncharacterized protein n=1 Tax=Aspergillus bertholletiae TaxID=1226010 RepID=A0A5N7B0L2_9EURO|nr:hypothetical protein BDV26DRAFT_22971 [Aspergillus bertholletiae]
MSVVFQTLNKSGERLLTVQEFSVVLYPRVLNRRFPCITQCHGGYLRHEPLLRDPIAIATVVFPAEKDEGENAEKSRLPNCMRVESSRINDKSGARGGSLSLRWRNSLPFLLVDSPPSLYVLLQSFCSSIPR